MDLNGVRALTFTSPFFLPSTCSRRSYLLSVVSSKTSPKPYRRPISPVNSLSHSFTIQASDCCGTELKSWKNGVGSHGDGKQSDKVLQIVLVSPQIPGNTGCIARTCAASSVGLHLVEPLGFKVDDSKLKRAGLDYWPYVVVKIHESWGEFRNYFNQQDGEKRLLAFTKRGKTVHSDFKYKKGDWLVFGSETSGLPTEALEDCNGNTFGGGTLRIPMVETYVRCLNLSVSVGIALYEASRQLNYEQLEFPACMDRIPIVSEDIFA